MALYSPSTSLKLEGAHLSRILREVGFSFDVLPVSGGFDRMEVIPGNRDREVSQNGRLFSAICDGGNYCFRGGVFESRRTVAFVRGAVPNQASAILIHRSNGGSQTSNSGIGGSPESTGEFFDSAVIFGSINHSTHEMGTSRRRLQEKDLPSIAYYLGTAFCCRTASPRHPVTDPKQTGKPVLIGNKTGAVEFGDLTSPRTGLAWRYHLRSNSGSNGLVAKECHRFLVAGPFKLLPKVADRYTFVVSGWPLRA